ncbi:hypothetical protein [Methylovirgula sp. 4M-Z18]|uniref:hypothetical protein n=1 Tax=Methylovirgula sp. 4M-Z18 TaxID=2293567 RepID=UPI000E2F3ACD|nr:hypothetical protein [Methylovirgula sp. 4M-Z18]RFB76679.1 hypothetical protein DYH55_19680 [Methylovirgula sp. 4M-Z18]
MKYQLTISLAFASTLAACGPPPPPSVDASKRVPINSPATQQNIALESGLITRQLINGGDRQGPTIDQANARLRAQIAYLDDKLHRHGVAYDQTIFIPIKDGTIAPDKGLQTQLTSSLNVSRAIEITASSAQLGEDTKNYLVQNGAPPTAVTVTVSDFSPNYVGVMLTYF